MIEIMKTAKLNNPRIQFRLCQGVIGTVTAREKDYKLKDFLIQFWQILIILKCKLKCIRNQTNL